MAQILGFLVLAFAPGLALAQLLAQEADESAFEAGLRWREGEVLLGDGLATLRLPAGLRFLGPDDSARVLVEAWGNPPQDEKPLGMIFPAELGPFAQDGWAVVVGFTREGYVSDADAEQIDYDALLAELQAAARAGNAEREKLGFPALEIVGWAARPYYDPAAHTLHWAKELHFADGGENTLNYDMRVLGRRGVLTMKAVASMGQLEALQRRAPELLSVVEFNPGHRYEEFDSNVDSVAAYGIGGLVAGGVLAKAGFFKALLAALLAAKKLVVVGAIAVGGFVTRFFSSRAAARRGETPR